MTYYGVRVQCGLGDVFFDAEAGDGGHFAGSETFSRPTRDPVGAGLSNRHAGSAPVMPAEMRTGADERRSGARDVHSDGETTPRARRHSGRDVERVGL